MHVFYQTVIYMYYMSSSMYVIIGFYNNNNNERNWSITVTLIRLQFFSYVGTD